MEKHKTIKDLNVKPETIKCLQENRVSMLSDNTLNSIFLNLPPQSRETKAKNNKWDYTKFKSFAQWRKPLTQNEKTTYWIGRDICKLYIQWGVNNQNI